MRRGLTWTLVLIGLVLLLNGCGGKSKQTTVTATPAPPAAPAVSVPGLPGDQAALKGALTEPSKVQYQVVTVDDTGGKDKDTYLDDLLAQRNWPEKSMLVLVVYTKENYDIRFAMGADFTEKQVGFEEILAFVRSSYLPKAKDGDPATGLATLIRSVNQRMAQ